MGLRDRCSDLPPFFVRCYKNGNLGYERALNPQPGIERVDGKIDALGRISLSGKGGYADRSSEWMMTFSGRLSDITPTVLKGELRVLAGMQGRRDCTITFLPPPAELMKVFGAK